ncbi:MAG: c-type cytochrome, partial [Planctomycetes bacterium]|nr:c-type cytochrome [Planctomycetota bacterium]
IGTHANSLIAFELPRGYTRFKARAGLDNGGTDQNAGRSTSVEFLVFTDELPAAIARAAAGNAPAGGNLPPEEALQALEVHPELEAKLFASEPLLLSPSSIDVDHLGRVWVCEVVNYWHFANKSNPPREEGDRILVLEDTDGDSQADKQTVFHQGRDVDSAHGVCVLASPARNNTRVIVSAGDSVFFLIDDDGDLKADRKELLFTGIGGTQHDHGIHAFAFGPDGKLYFNFGNSGKQIKDAAGRPITDKAGNVVNDRRQPYQEGMVFRCNLDGSELETLGWNFRNNWEVAVDSFGTLWQSDNDDDGNRGVRINFVMEFGNYGYKDELTGAGWQAERTGMHAEIPLRHWHINDPGVVPNLWQTGAGSPTGICVYEGDLLPEVFRGEIIHCDAGPNVVRAYPVVKDGAGYKASMVNILEGARDKWFRPSDVCVAPDGSLIVADWYDPGVGGHRMGDIEQGRLYRIAPPGTPYRVPQHDFTTAEGAVKALASPNLATRYIAWEPLHEMGEEAVPVLRKVWESDADDRLRARVLWLLGKMAGHGREAVAAGLESDNPDLRITALRLARQVEDDVLPIVAKLAQDASPQVRRECLIAMANHKSPEVPRLWAQFAGRHDGKDRWYLEALGIAARSRWEACFEAWLALDGEAWNTPPGRDIVWRARTAAAIPYLAKIILDSETSADELPRYFRAFDFHRDADSLKNQTLASLALEADGPHRERISELALKHLGSIDLAKSPELKPAVEQALERAKGTPRFVQMVERFNLADRYPEVVALAQLHPGEQVGVEAARILLEKDQQPLIAKALANPDEKLAAAMADALGNSLDGRATGPLRRVMNDKKAAVSVRRAAVRGLGRLKNGSAVLVELAKGGSLEVELKDAVAAAMHGSEFPDVRQAAQQLFPLPPTKDDQPLPPIEQLVKRIGDATRGRVLFNTTATCVKCHKVDGIGKEVGPDLSEIGGKLSRHAMYESMLYPSAGISHGYETYTLVLASGNTVSGLVTSRTPEEITVRSQDALDRTFKTSEVDEIVKQNVSLMPADIQKTMTVQELVDVVEYMTTLKKKPVPETKAAAGER